MLEARVPSHFDADRRKAEKSHTEGKQPKEISPAGRYDISV
ncbi:hypothetical protein [Galbibacter mesophilus]|nr:hypothetical protein [Galbibacter mesophilus]